MQNRDAEKTNRERAYPKKSLAVTSQAPVRRNGSGSACFAVCSHGMAVALRIGPGQIYLAVHHCAADLDGDVLQGIDAGGKGVAAPG